jgi:hypothetical protein
LNAPGGGECGEITDNTGNSLDAADSSSATNARATVIDDEPGRFGAITTAGSGALAAQQFVRRDCWDLDACEQQLCAALCAGSKQAPNGASNAPIKRMAKTPRCKTPRLIDEVYHKIDSAA